MSLPLQARVAIRDNWDNADSSLQKTIRNVQDVLGHDIVVQPEWPLLLAELEGLYSDKANLVTTVAGCVETWCKALAELLEDESNEEWVDTLLEHVRPHLRIILEISKSGTEETSWQKDRSSFVISIPKTKIYNASMLFPAFKGGILEAFNQKDKSKSSGLAHRPKPAADDWADVQVNTATGKPDVVDKTAPPSAPSAGPSSAAAPLYHVDFLPNAASMPRPDELLLRPPFHLVISEQGQNSVEIESSHSPSLQLLGDYFKRWCRVNHADSRSPPGVKVTLHQSAWGLGTMYDRLSLTTENTRYTDQFAVNATIVLALVEGALGYRMVSSEGGRWFYRRDAEFKRM